MNTCRFCLIDSKNIQFKLLSRINSAYIKLILPELDINLAEYPKICSTCLNSLEDAYNFKTRCLKLEEKLKDSPIKCKVEMNIDSKNDIERQIQNNNVALKVELDCEKTQDSTSENQIKSIPIKHEIDISENEINCWSEEKKPFKCNDCGNKYRYKFQLVTHMDIHLGPKKHICKKCFQGYRNAGRLRIHMKTHKNPAIKPYKCNFCRLKFTCKGSLKKHTLSHTEKIYICDICQKEFDNQRSFNCHMLVHKKKECEMCGRRFPNLYNLRKHMHLHNKKSLIPFQCNYCGKCYEKQTVLQKHNCLPEYEKDKYL